MNRRRPEPLSLTYQSRGSHHRHRDLSSLVGCEACFMAASYQLDQGIEMLQATEGDGSVRVLTDAEIAEVRMLLTSGDAA